mmetsp:Transcript_17554/g.38390  ORF Transcript_17554/g.38390 Transcript_17554/m.38390 type:complete len:538 (+) Transcript_17554:176-1789(+)
MSEQGRAIGSGSSDISPRQLGGVKKVKRLFAALDRMPVAFARTGQVEEAPTINNVSIDSLIGNASEAMGTMRYIYPDALRKLGATVRFREIDKVLADLSATLLQGRSATAELSMVTVCTTDATQNVEYGGLKLFEGHILTLCVTCEGDWKNAYEGGDFVLSRRSGTDTDRWSGGRPGSYGCWYPCERISASPLEGEEGSYRVVLVYSVRVGGIPKKKVRDKGLPSWISQPSSDLSVLSNEIGGIIIGYLGSRELGRISQCCSQLRQIGSRVRILTALLLECKEDLDRIATKAGEKFALAIPLQWPYRPRGSHVLRYAGIHLCQGDYLLFLAAKAAFPDGNIFCHRAVVRREEEEEEDVDIDSNSSGEESSDRDGEPSVTLRIFQGETGVEEVSPLEESELKALLRNRKSIDYDLLRGKKGLTVDAMRMLLIASGVIIDGSVDIMESRILWPFFGTIPIFGRTYLENILSRLEPYEGVESPRGALDHFETSCLVIDFCESETEKRRNNFGISDVDAGFRSTDVDAEHITLPWLAATYV